MLSPAFDINLVTPANGLHLNISDNDNSLSYELAMEVIDFFRLSEEGAVQIKNKVLASVGNWEAVAIKAGIGLFSCSLMNANKQTQIWLSTGILLGQ